MTTTKAPDQKPFTIAIVGGGLGGVILAVSLLQHNIPVTIYESAKSFGEIGAGMTFGQNAIRSLNLISPTLLSAFKKHATYNESPERSSTIHTFRYAEDSKNGDGGKAGDLVFHLEDEGDTSEWEELGMKPRCCVHRARFLDEIINLVPEGITSFNKSLDRIEEDDNDDQKGRIHLHFADGSDAYADAVIGCDGIKSKTRQHILGTRVSPIYAEEYAYRAMVPKSDFEKAMGTEAATNGQIHLGYGRYVITYPVDNGKLINMVMLRLDPETRWKHDTWLDPTSEEDMQEEIKGIYPPLAGLLSKYSSRDKWAIHEICHDEKYYKGRICLLGDSAHASTPHLGAGASSAIEDAYVMSNLLNRIDRKEDLNKVFEAFDAVRRPRSQQLVRYSRVNGLAHMFSEEGVGDDTNKYREHVTKRWRWVWDEDLEAQLQRAVSLLEERRAAAMT